MIILDICDLIDNKSEISAFFCCSDSGWGDDQNDTKNTVGYLFMYVSGYVVSINIIFDSFTCVNCSLFLFNSEDNWVCPNNFEYYDASKGSYIWLEVHSSFITPPPPKKVYYKICVNQYVVSIILSWGLKQDPYQAYDTFCIGFLVSF